MEMPDVTDCTWRLFLVQPARQKVIFRVKTLFHGSTFKEQPLIFRQGKGMNNISQLLCLPSTGRFFNGRICFGTLLFPNVFFIETVSLLTPLVVVWLGQGE